MKLYKFRSTNNFEYIVDILLRKRLHCCNIKQFNDVTEGDFRSGNEDGHEVEYFEKGLNYSKRLKELKVCSLTKTFNNHLLWAYYANGYNGVAIELDIPDSPNKLYEVEYTDDFIYFSDLVLNESTDIDYSAKPLCMKKKRWSHENEMRIIVEDEFYKLQRPISRVIIGSRVNFNMGHVFYLLCSKLGIPLERAVIADWGIYTVGFQNNYFIS